MGIGVGNVPTTRGSLTGGLPGAHSDPLAVSLPQSSAPPEQPDRSSYGVPPHSGAPKTRR